MAKKMSDLEKVWKNWNENPSDAQKAYLLKKARPRIEQAILSHAGRKGLSDPVVRLQAESMATKAFESYDPERAKLSTYIHSQLRPLKRVVHYRVQNLDIPPTIWADRKQMKQALEEFENEEGREPSTSELADYTGLSTRRISTLRNFSEAGIPEGALRKHNPEVVQAFKGEDEDDEIGLWARAVYDSLGPEDQRVMEYRTGMFGREKLSNKEIAKKLGISEPAVSQRAGQIANFIAKGLT